MYYDVDGSLMDQLGKSVRELQDVTGNDYSRYNVSPHIIGGLARTNPNVQEYRSNLGGLISRLYGEFFSDEVNPLSGSPSTVIHQNQNQQVHIQILLDFQNLLNQASSKTDLDDKERGFIDKLKDSLCLLYTSPSPRDRTRSRMPSSA